MNKTEHERRERERAIALRYIARMKSKQTGEHHSHLKLVWDKTAQRLEAVNSIHESKPDSRRL